MQVQQIIITAGVMNVEVEVISASSVRVSWDRFDIPEITGYTVHYNQMGSMTRESRNVSSSTSVTCVIM